MNKQEYPDHIQECVKVFQKQMIKTKDDYIAGIFMADKWNLYRELVTLLKVESEEASFQHLIYMIRSIDEGYGVYTKYREELDYLRAAIKNNGWDDDYEIYL
jgi:hypothetical protein